MRRLARDAARAPRAAACGSPRAPRNSAGRCACRCRPRPGAHAYAGLRGGHRDRQRRERSDSYSKTSRTPRSISSSGYFFGRGMNVEFLSRGLNPSLQGLRQTRPASYWWLGRERPLEVTGGEVYTAGTALLPVSGIPGKGASRTLVGGSLVLGWLAQGECAEVDGLLAGHAAAGPAPQ